ncbi:MAG: phosphate transport system ATP-binding protein [Actinomycetota bacterium]|nr:phosphate transport system ATP-binding protein [Actinomycetota bacterium]
MTATGDDLQITLPDPSAAHRNGQATRPAVDASALEARDVKAWFGRSLIVADVNLAMPPGSVTAIIGPSGCGKSTFLRVLNRMHELTPGARLAGDVLLDGEDIYATGSRPARMRLQVGMVFQKPNPFPTMTIAENVLSGLRLAGISVGDKAQVVESRLGQAGLWAEVKDRLREPAGSLSGGQQQRLCIARSLAVSPKVLLMDEPCSALDPSSTKRIEETIRQISTSVTVVIVTHNMQQACRVSDYTAFFLADQGDPGRVVEFGATNQVFSTPNDPRTEDYIHGRFG